MTSSFVLKNSTKVSKIQCCNVMNSMIVGDFVRALHLRVLEV